MLDLLLYYFMWHLFANLIMWFIYCVWNIEWTITLIKTLECDWDKNTNTLFTHSKNKILSEKENGSSYSFPSPISIFAPK